MDNEPSGWAIGWTGFAAIMMATIGAGWSFVGIVAIMNDDFYVVGREHIFNFDVTMWGWIHLILGIVILLAGFYLFTGAAWARVVGVTLAVVWTLVAFAWLPHYPIWGLLLIAASISVIWALTVHGRDIAEPYVAP